MLIPAGDYPGSLWVDGGLVPLGNTNSYYKVPDGTFRFLRQKNLVHGTTGMFIDPQTGILMARLDTGFGSRLLPIPDAQFEKHRCMRRTTSGLQTEVIYTGEAKGVVTLQYREFSNGLARPAFSQDYTFDLASGNELAFRGTRIRVIKVDNAGLRYVVL